MQIAEQDNQLLLNVGGCLVKVTFSAQTVKSNIGAIFYLVNY